MTAERMPVTPSVVLWARQRAGFSIDDLVHDFGKIESWESGEDGPTYPQLERLADKLKVPVAVFFFPAPPNVPPIEETFRTLGPDQISDIPPRVRLLLRKARAFQIGLAELNQGRNPADRLITRDLGFRTDDRIEAIAESVRAYLGVTLEEQFSWPNTEVALDRWRDVFRSVGIYVFKDQFRNPDYSGFCLFDDVFPIIYVNNSTTKTRQIFTLFHELAHLLFHTSGVDAIDDSYIRSLTDDSQRIEVICNRLAACVLVPEQVFDEVLADQAANAKTAENLAQIFSVSREFIYRKFLDRQLITRREYAAAAQRWAEQIKRGRGGNPYNTKISYLGRDYVSLAFQQYYQNRIGYNELAEYLDTKPKYLTKLEEYFSRRAI